MVLKDLELRRLREQKSYENKITELESIIKELSQNLNYHFLTIQEEEEESREQENQISMRKSNSNAIKNTEDFEEFYCESNLNSEIEIASKERSKQISNELVMSEREEVNARGIDRKVSHETHSSALDIDRLAPRITESSQQIDPSALRLRQSRPSVQRFVSNRNLSHFYCIHRIPQ